MRRRGCACAAGCEAVEDRVTCVRCRSWLSRTAWLDLGGSNARPNTARHGMVSSRRGLTVVASDAHRGRLRPGLTLNENSMPGPG